MRNKANVAKTLAFSSSVPVSPTFLCLLCLWILKIRSLLLSSLFLSFLCLFQFFLLSQSCHTNRDNVRLDDLNSRTSLFCFESYFTTSCSSDTGWTTESDTSSVRRAKSRRFRSLKCLVSGLLMVLKSLSQWLLIVGGALWASVALATKQY